MTRELLQGTSLGIFVSMKANLLLQCLPVMLYSLVCGIVPVQVFCQLPTISWRFDVKDNAFGQPAMGNIGGNGKPYIVFGCYRNDGMVYALDAATGDLLWRFDEQPPGLGCNDAAPVIYDVDDDGAPEVLFASSCTAATFCLDGKTGNVRWRTATRGSDSPAVIADLDGDGKMEVIHGQFGGYVVCLDASDGSVKWEISVDPNSWVQTAPTVVDLDGDNTPDFVVATWGFDNNSAIYAYRGIDQTLLWSRPLADVAYHGTTVTDIFGDEQPELVIGDYSGLLYVVEGATGSLLWSYQGPGYIGSPVVAADLDSDGACELIATSGSSVVVLRSTGAVLWQYDIPGIYGAFRGVVVVDLGADNILDVVFGTDGGSVIALRGNDGAELWNINLAEDYGDSFEISTAPLIGDFDGDGNLDLFVVGGKSTYPDVSGNYGRAYSLKLGSGKGRWPMFQYDVQRTSSICPLVPSAVRRSITANKLDVGVDYGANLLVLRTLPELHNEPFVIADVLGRVISSGRIEKEQHYVQLQSYWNGVYFFSVNGQSKAFVVSR